jgi:hypothetical protein
VNGPYTFGPAARIERHAMRVGIAGHPWTLAELLENAGV